MTIKRRLFISNILMLIIPAALAVIALMASLIFFFILAFPHAEYRLSLHEELMEMRGHVLELATDWLSDSNVAHKNEAESSLSRIVERNQLTIQIKEGQKLLLQFGSGTVPSQDRLEQALATLDGKGSVSDGHLVKSSATANWKRFQRGSSS